nr:retrotransposon protein, putative, Ty1-copia subclass [Tanacetum cinerariifolium]
MGKTVGELHALLIEHEKGLPKKAATLQVMAIQDSRIQKANKKLQNAKGKGRELEKELSCLPGWVDFEEEASWHCQFFRSKKAETRSSLFVDYGISVSKNDVLYFNVISSNGIYEIDMIHRKKRIEKLQHDGLLKSTDEESFDKCVSYLSGKMTRKPFPHRTKRATDLLGIIHTDVCGPLRHVSRKEISGRAEELEEIQDADTSPFENTSDIPMEVEGFEPPQKKVVPIRRLSQSAYIDKILKRYRMDNSKCGYIPMQEKFDLNKTQGASTPEEVKRIQNVPYALAVRSIMYAVRYTKPDVMFVQNIYAILQQNPGEPHWTAMKTILKYLKNTKDMFLVYGGNPEAELRVDCYCDAGFKTDKDDTKSQTCYIFILNGGAID